MSSKSIDVDVDLPDRSFVVWVRCVRRQACASAIIYFRRGTRSVLNDTVPAVPCVRRWVRYAEASVPVEVHSVAARSHLLWWGMGLTTGHAYRTYSSLDGLAWGPLSPGSWSNQRVSISIGCIYVSLALWYVSPSLLF